MSPASSGQPRPAVAYALWLDSLTRAGWEAGPAAEQVAGGRRARPGQRRSDRRPVAVAPVRLLGDGRHRGPGRRADRRCHAAEGGAVLLPAGTFEWIDTGDPMPGDADTVVMREWLLPQKDGGLIIVPGGLTAGGADATSTVSTGTGDPATGGIAVPLGKNVRLVGEDFAAGAELVPAGRRLRPGDLAAAAAGGHSTVLVARQPVVAIIPTGDEIRPLGSTARPGEILDTNSLMLAARCRQLNAIPALSEIQPDDPDALAAEIRRCAHDADLVLVIAGSSRGRGDHAAAVLAQVGGVAVTGVAVRPGHPALLGHAKHPGSAARPTASGRAGVAPVIGLPGYPLASAVIFELFAAPLLAALQGVRPAVRPARAGRARPGLVVPARHRGLGAGDTRPRGRLARPRRAARRHPGQARRRVDQPARPRRRLVADPARPDRLHFRRRHRAATDPERSLLSRKPPADGRAASGVYLQPDAEWSYCATNGSETGANVAQ